MHASLADDLPLLVKDYGLGQVSDARYLAEGLMNRNWRVSTARGEFALKQIVDVTLPLARRNLAVVAALAAAGVPTAVAAPSTTGDLVVEVGDRGYALFPWVPGEHIAGPDLTGEQADALGAVLGRIHQELNKVGQSLLPEKPGSLRASVAGADKARTEAERFMGLAAADDSDFGRQVIGSLEQRRVLLDKYAGQRPTSEVPLGPFGWRHGDFQHLNVKWHDGQIRAVLDWDRIRVGSFAEEVARSATLIFGREQGDLDLAGVTEFVRGYRSVAALSDEELKDAVLRLWWKRMCDYWHLEFHYDRGDHSCDHLFLSASLFLDWWTSRFDEVQAAFLA
ncbi:phosphotransferase [Streptomyces fulvoviolaceus]|uniref:phosphotransferase n=1 Tax=Streptomyces fulvoviolaceus TaxID=285535 RepID=UPI0021BF3C5A|nr:phosphotransferase [Streptomyces fulvoviolaceus]MCT9080440.1 phosphotransferase [Streptomyces fulvoviolaceus]